MTTFDEDGYPIYRRRDNGRVVIKNGVSLDNMYVVPHNRNLLLKYGAHINVEWCNQSRSIKYLFKYINKGHDHVTASFYQSNEDKETVQIVDEIKMYYDCRYISPCEAVWRIFGFDIQYRDPAVERLSFHLPNEQSIIFSNADRIENVLQRPSVNKSMFLAWMKANKKYSEAFSIGRLYYVPPGSGDLYYERCLLNVVRGATCYEDLMCVNGVQYSSYRDACYALGLLDDDKEYIDGIIEASHWASTQCLRTLFVTLLSSDSLARPEVVWQNCWTCQMIYYINNEL